MEIVRDIEAIDARAVEEASDDAAQVQDGEFDASARLSGVRHRTPHDRLQRFARELVALYWDSGVANDIPALAWFLLSSLVPLALGITALAAVALGDYAKAQALSVRISKVLPKDVGVSEGIRLALKALAR